MTSDGIFLIDIALIARDRIFCYRIINFAEITVERPIDNANFFLVVFCMYIHVLCMFVPNIIMRDKRRFFLLGDARNRMIWEMLYIYRNLGPVSRLLRRRHHATCLATKSCDNIYSVNRNSNSLDWRVNQNANEQGNSLTVTHTVVN